MSKLKIKENIHLIYEVLLNCKSAVTISNEFDMNGFESKEMIYNNITLNITNTGTIEIIDPEYPMKFLFGLNVYEDMFYICFPGEYYNEFKKIETDEEYFQQSLINDYHDLNLEDIILINKIHHIMKGHFTKE